MTSFKKSYLSTRWSTAATLTQFLLLALVLGVIAYAVTIGGKRLAALGLPSGFDFLLRPSGFDIGQRLVDYDSFSTYGRALLVAVLNTLVVSAAGIVLATLLGFVIGIAQLSTNWLASAIARSYVALFRNIPLLLQIFFWYFAVLRSLPSVKNSATLLEIVYLNNRGIVLPRPILPQSSWLAIAAVAVACACLPPLMRRLGGRGRFIATPSFAILIGACGLALICALQLDWEVAELRGFNFLGGLTLTPEFVALLFGLTIYTSAFIAEIIRAGLIGVHRGQYEAARSLGLRRGQMLRLVIIPQALRIAVPPLTSQYLNLTKNTSLGSAIAYPELVSVFAGTAMNQTGQAVETIGLTMAIYLSLSLTIAALMRWYERRTVLVGSAS